MMPTKKVLSVFIVVAALVAAIMLAFGRDKSSVAINYASNLVAGEKIKIPENPNWQNELSGVVPAEQIKDFDSSTQTSNKNNEAVTDVVSKSFMTNYLALKQNDNLNQESAQKLIDQTVDYVDKLSDASTAVTQLNLIDNGSQTTFDYGENLGNILKNNRPSQVKNEIEIITKAMETKDETKINELDSIILVYKKIANELVKMPVPKTFAKVHLDTTNKMMTMAIALEEIKLVFNDPIRGLAALQKYERGATVFAQAIQATVTFLRQNNIVYKQGSGGYYLLYGI